MRRKSVRTRRAFTLIELLLVAGILALLAAFAIPRLMGQAEKARAKLAEAAIGRNGPIAKALDAYRWDMGKYPETDEGLNALLQRKSRVDDERYNGPYLENDKIEDPWASPFEYRSPGEFHEDGFDMWSRGPDRKDDGGKEGSDDIKNWIEK